MGAHAQLPGVYDLTADCVEPSHLRLAPSYPQVRLRLRTLGLFQEVPGLRCSTLNRATAVCSLAPYLATLLERE